MFINSVADITVTDVSSSLRIINSPVNVTVKRSNRERWAVAMKISGKTVYNCNGKEILSDKFHPVILPKGCSYSWKCTEPGVCLIIDFHALESGTEILGFTISDNTFFTSAFSKIENALNHKTNDYKIECKYHLYGIISYLLKSRSKEYVTKDKQKLLAPAIEYITQNYFDGNITNNYLSGLCGISTVYFRKTFEAIYGIPPIKFLHNFRIKIAKNMLLSDYESIEQVALSVGYNSIYHFSKMFKIYTGMSPTEYVKESHK